MDGQLFTPPYLLNPDGSLATRPNITVAPAGTALPGDVLTVVTDSLIASFSIIRRGCAACLGLRDLLPLPSLVCHCCYITSVRAVPCLAAALRACVSCLC